LWKGQTNKGEESLNPVIQAPMVSARLVKAKPECIQLRSCNPPDWKPSWTKGGRKEGRLLAGPQEY